MKPTTTATIRTAVPSAWATLLVWLIARAGWTLEEADWQVLFVVMPVVLGVFYRLARVVEARWPMIGHVLFGSSKTPNYDASTPDAG